MAIDEVLLEAEEAMEKAVDYLRAELRGVRTGRASTGLVEFIKVEAYGGHSDIRQLASVTTPEPTQILIKPYDPTILGAIDKAIKAAGLGLNPIAEGKAIRVSIPALSGERRQQLIASVKQMGEQAKISIRNARRDGNKAIDAAGKDKAQSVSEDEVEDGKNEIQDLVKKYEKRVEDIVDAKVTEVQEV